MGKSKDWKADLLAELRGKKQPRKATGRSKRPPRKGAAPTGPLPIVPSAADSRQSPRE